MVEVDGRSAVSDTDQGLGSDPESDWEKVQASPEFTELRRRLRVFVFPVSALFLLWYLLYVILADYATGFMSTKLFGNITVGLVFGLLQFVSTFVITGLYVRYANRKLDPLADKIRHEVEGTER
ncbi:clumping factor B [Amycolatopsis thailandensis]|uniref:Clumping factor B n=1 Tax=Amycolatopsis thailandensis TaxID=589330 RepID=A0A229SIS0_9PSEU|nr:clumping factor B [Amycolatopsis thailandensis]